MDSLTKNKKDKNVIAALFQQAHCTEAEIESVSELTNGSFNAVYQVALTNGSRYVLKIAPAASTTVLRNEKDTMGAEAEALRLVLKNTSVPVPAVFHYAEYSSCCDSPFMIMQWMDGEEYQYASNSYSDETKSKVLMELGTMTNEFHQIHRQAFGRFGKNAIQFSTWSEAFTALFQNILEDGMAANVTLPFDYDSLAKLEERVNPILNDVKMPCLIHGDLWLGNVLVHKKRISAILDFERSLWGDPLMEYPFGLLRNNLDFLNGYQHVVLDDADFSMKLRRALYNLYHYLIVIIEKPYRGMKGGSSNYFVNQKLIVEVKSIEKLLQS